MDSRSPFLFEKYPFNSRRVCKRFVTGHEIGASIGPRGRMNMYDVAEASAMRCDAVMPVYNLCVASHLMDLEND